MGGSHGLWASGFRPVTSVADIPQFRAPGGDGVIRVTGLQQQLTPMFMADLLSAVPARHAS